MTEPESAPPTDAPAPEPAPPRARFRPHERIRDPADFRRAFDRKRSVADPVMVVYGVENGRDHPRLGVTVSRRKVRRAVARNRIKRVLREAFRTSKADLPPGVDLVIVPRDPAMTLDAARRSLVRLARDAARRLAQAPRRPPDPTP